MVSFEADEPGEFLDLVQELRGTESSSYTLRDTPIFTCVATSVAKALDALDGAAAAVRPCAARVTFRRFLLRDERDRNTREQPLRVAIVGAGPSGFYAAEDLLKGSDDGPVAEVDLYDRLPTPFGLVRGGVAPDHPKIKSVTRYEKTAKMPGFRFFGNVTIGEELKHEDLAAHYHAVIYTSARRPTASSASPARTCPAATPATEFVGWYNAHPDYADHEFDLSASARS